MAKSFLRGPKFFKLCPIVFNNPNRFFQGGGRFAGKASPPFPLVTGLCPIVSKMSNTFLHGGAKIFLASYGPGFAP